MRVLITGGGGTLGTALAPRLAAAGHDPVLVDIAPIESSYEFRHADVRRAADMTTVMGGVDVVVHTAAVHGIHLRDHAESEFYELNLTGTLNVWQAAVAAGVRGLVFSSTMGVYGESREPVADDSVVAVDEELPLLPTDIYGYTKVAGEAMCRYYARRHGIRSVALRFGMFVPEPFFRYGIRLLYGGVDTADAVSAVLASVDALSAGRIEWDTFNVESLVPFREEDGPLLRRDPLLVIDRYYPGAAQLLRDRGVDALRPISSFYPMARIERRLGVRPSCNFADWLEELHARPHAVADTGTPWP